MPDNSVFPINVSGADVRYSEQLHTTRESDNVEDVTIRLLEGAERLDFDIHPYTFLPVVFFLKNSGRRAQRAE